MASTWYVDFEGGNNGNTGASFAQRLKTLAGATAAKGITAGDTVRIMASLDYTTLGSCTWTDNSQTVTIPAGTTKDIDMCESAWTAGAGVTSTAVSTLPKQGTFNANLVIGGGYVAGNIMAYKALAGSTDFSGFQQLNIWFKSSAATAAGDYEIRLCSDAVGAVAVDTFAIPAVPVTTWVPVVVNKGSALGAAIQSVSIYRIAGAGTPTIQIDGLFASKAVGSADEVTIKSLIGKNDGRGWWGIQSVTGTTLKLDGNYNWGSNQYQTWYGTTGAATTYVRKPIDLGYAVVQTNILAGTAAGGYITLSGGWDRTAMTTQSGETFYSNYALSGAVFTQQQAYVSFEKLSFYGGTNAWLMTSGKSQKLSYCNWGMTTVGLSAQSFASCGIIMDNCSSAGCDSGVINMGSGWIVRNSHFIGGNSYGFGQYAPNGTFENCSFGGTAGFGVRCVGLQYGAQGFGSVFRSCTMGQNVSGDVLAESGPNYFDNCLFSSTTEFFNQFNQGASDVIYSTNHDQTADSHTQIMFGGRVFSNASVRHTASGISWKMSPTSTSRNADYPLRLRVARAYVRAGTLVTAKMWFQRDSTSLTGLLFVRGTQIGGPSSDQSATVSAGANTWEELTVTWTPTVAGVVEIEALAYGGTTLNLYVDDMTISQA